MTNHRSISSASLHGSIGERISLAWKPRDIRQRLRSQRDKNWLTVHGRIDAPSCGNHWSFTDACLTEGEAAELVEFLSVRPWPADARLEPPSLSRPLLRSNANMDDDLST